MGWLGPFRPPPPRTDRAWRGAPTGTLRVGNVFAKNGGNIEAVDSLRKAVSSREGLRTPGTTKTPEGTTRPLVRVHQCKHRLLQTLGRLAPPGKTYCTSAPGRSDTYLSTSFNLRGRIRRSSPRAAHR